jgi:cysteine-rich repeat protein
VRTQFVFCVALIASACSGGEERTPPSGVGGPGGPRPIPSAEVCEPGSERECGIERDARNGVVTCYVGTQTCNDAGRWSECQHGMLRTLASPVRPPGVSGPAFRPLALSTPVDCVDNPCDPGCQVFEEDPPVPVETPNSDPVYIRAPGTSAPTAYHDPAEACDDGNDQAGDGCDASCAVEASETEPNGARETADEWSEPFYAEIAPAADEDFVVFDVAEPGTLVAETLDLGEQACERGTLDSFLQLFDASGDLLASDDDGGERYCARLSVANTQAGRYFLRVSAASSGETPVFPYRLALRIE